MEALRAAPGVRAETLDLMPSQPGVLSFHNRWYPLAVSTASHMTLPSGRSIKLIAAAVFIATKLEAFKGRGNSDFLASHDLEDIVTVVDGRPELLDELRGAPEELLSAPSHTPTASALERFGWSLTLYQLQRFL